MEKMTQADVEATEVEVEEIAQAEWGAIVDSDPAIEDAE